MANGRIQRPDDTDYYVAPWSSNVMQGDFFDEVPLGFPVPPDAVFVAEGERHFLTGPFDAALAMLITPSCAMAAQGAGAGPDVYAHPARTLVPMRPVQDLLNSGAVRAANLGNLRSDRLVNYMYLPERDGGWPESAALLYLPITMHHDVIDQNRVAQLTGTAFWHLRSKLMAFAGGFAIQPSEFGEPPEPQSRQS